KPDEQYPFIEAASPGPYLGMFARHAQPGWTAWGDEAGEDVTPRGKASRGYEGGEADFPWLNPHERLDDAEALALAAKLAEEYAAGAGLQTLADRHGYSHQRVRRLLEGYGVELRRRGRPSTRKDERSA